MTEFKKLDNLEQTLGLEKDTKIQVDGQVKAFTYGRNLDSKNFTYSGFLVGANYSEVLIHGTADILDLPILKRSSETGKPIKIQGQVYSLKARAPFIGGRAIKVSAFRIKDYASPGWEIEES